MIKLITRTGAHHKILNDASHLVCIKLFYVFADNGSQEYHNLIFQLKNMRFDPRSTKPLDVSGFEILKILNNSEEFISIKAFTQNYFKWRFTPVNAYTIPSYERAIYINTRQLFRRSLKEWEETLWHELIHYADNLSVFQFDHGDNNPNGDEETAPAKLARFMANLTIY